MLLLGPLAGADDDINFVPFARLAPAQPRLRLHRLQQFYLWALYWFLFPKWNFVDDFKGLAQAQISGHVFPRPRGTLLAQLIAGKSFNMMSSPWRSGPCEAEFPELPPDTARLPRPWAVHQVQTTVDFARGNRLLTWYVGGLNFQIEHHLFPHICHVHYPRIAEIVEGTCAEFGVRYTAHASFRGALASLWGWLSRMGRADTSPAREPASGLAQGASVPLLLS